jgi:MtN3 and saliva related transmembrane protein
MDWITLAGTIAAICSTVSFVPQAWRILRTRDTSSISPAMYSLTVLGFALWTSYGIGLGQWPLIATNAICFLLAGFILIMTVLPQRSKNAAADKLDPSN